MTLVIGTRGSELALTQSRHVAALLERAGVASTLQIIRTKGDEVTHLSFDKIEGKGFFTKELEEALLAGRIDLAVHSLKDLPTESPAGLVVAAMPAREDARDCLIVRRERHEAAGAVLPLRQGARVGTSAVRRRAQLTFLRPDLQVVDLRGNVPTRVRRLSEGAYDAIVLARAGLNRLNLDLSSFETWVLPPELFVPAPAQGMLALQVRAADTQVLTPVAALHDSEAAALVQAERAVLAQMGGGCHVPLGAHAIRQDADFAMHLFWAHPQTSLAPRRLTVAATDPGALPPAALTAVRAP
jgi:hydroxymethylbilane synthase